MYVARLPKVRKVTPEWVKLYWVVFGPLAPSTCAFRGKDMPMHPVAALS